jgi:hypothetical protein
MVRGGIAMDTFKIAQGFQKSGLSFDSLTIEGTSDMQNAFGEVTHGVEVYKDVMSNATVQRIQYGNVDQTSLDPLAQLSNSIYLQSSFGWSGSTADSLN